jgi:hypothetical protein
MVSECGHRQLEIVTPVTTALDASPCKFKLKKMEIFYICKLNTFFGWALEVVVFVKQEFSYTTQTLIWSYTRALNPDLCKHFEKQTHVIKVTSRNRVFFE